MATFTYTRNRPNPPNDPSIDAPDMQTNCNSIDEIIHVDHYSFGESNKDGWHRIIHQPVEGSSPAPTSGLTQLYSKNYTPNTNPPSSAGTQLFMTNNAGEIQMTGTAQISNGGFAFCNGIIFQWGQVTFAASSTGTVTFQSVTAGTSIPFPNNCFNVQATMIGTSSSGQTIQITSKSNTAFNWQFTTNPSSTSYTGFYWLAIGN